MNWNSTTTDFLLRATSRKGLHSGFPKKRDQPPPRLLVARPSEEGPPQRLKPPGEPEQRRVVADGRFVTPMLLYMRPAIIATVKKGSPWMKYRVGTQRIGELVAS